MYRHAYIFVNSHTPCCEVYTANPVHGESTKQLSFRNLAENKWFYKLPRPLPIHSRELEAVAKLKRLPVVGDAPHQEMHKQVSFDGLKTQLQYLQTLQDSD